MATAKTQPETNALGEAFTNVFEAQKAFYGHGDSAMAEYASNLDETTRVLTDQLSAFFGAPVQMEIENNNGRIKIVITQV